MTLQDGVPDTLADCMDELSKCRTLQEKYTQQLNFTLHIAGFFSLLTLNLLTTTIVAPPSNASKWQMGFNSAFKEMHENQQIHQLFIQFIMYGSSYMFRHYIAIFRERS